MRDFRRLWRAVVDAKSDGRCGKAKTKKVSAVDKAEVLDGSSEVALALFYNSYTRCLLYSIMSSLTTGSVST